MGIIDILELKTDSGMYVGIAMIFMFALMALPLAYGDTLKGKGVEIVIEKTLIISGNLHYSDIKSYDNTDPRISGSLVKSADDIKRAKTPYQNSCAMYKYSPTYRVYILAPQCRDVIPKITIVSNLDQYHRVGQEKITEVKNSTLKDYKAIESKRVFSHTWYVDSTCTNAVMSAKNYTTVLPSMIEYLKSGCTSPILDNITPDIKKITQHDYTTSSKYKLEQFYKQVKECGKIKNGCKDLVNPQVVTRPDTK